MTSPFKGETGIKRIFNATGYSMSGISLAYRGEAAFRQLVWISLILIPISFFLPVSKAELALLIGVCLISLIVELLNSSIEAVVDRISLEVHPLSKAAKDMGSAAQFFASTLIAATWVIVLFF